MTYRYTLHVGANGYVCSKGDGAEEFKSNSRVPVGALVIRYGFALVAEWRTPAGRERTALVVLARAAEDYE